METVEIFNYSPAKEPIKHSRSEDTATKRVHILNSSFDPVTTKETVDWVIRSIQQGKRGYICTVNVAILMMMRNNERLAKFINKAALIVADGQPIIWASQLFATPLPHRVTGIDLIDELAAVSEQLGLHIYLLGATTEVIAAAVSKLRSKYPRLNISFDNGYFTPQQAAERAEAIRQSGADILFVGMGVPRQEYFLEEHWANLDVKLAIGIGGSFDVIAGRKKRAPLWVQEVGLEWLYRLLQEPRRLWKRYLFTNLQFLYRLLRALISKIHNKHAG